MVFLARPRENVCRNRPQPQLISSLLPYLHSRGINRWQKIASSCASIIFGWFVRERVEKSKTQLMCMSYSVQCCEKLIHLMYMYLVTVEIWEKRITLSFHFLVQPRIIFAKCDRDFHPCGDKLSRLPNRITDRPFTVACRYLHLMRVSRGSLKIFSL